MLSKVSLSVALLSLSAGLHASAHAQACTLGRVTERVAPMYSVPLNGRVLQGVVEVFAVFGPNGRVTSSRVLVGPQSLRSQTEAYVRGWVAEPSSDTRECSVTVEYRFDGAPRTCQAGAQASLEPERLDDTHMLLHLTCDNAWQR